jgi:hypothetical protein
MSNVGFRVFLGIKQDWALPTTQRLAKAPDLAAKTAPGQEPGPSTRCSF